MAIPVTVTEFLKKMGVSYKVERHPHSATSLQSAVVAKVPASRVAKAVVFKREDGYLLAVLPADRDIDRKSLEDSMEEDLLMAQESELGELFPDCEVGAVPAIGPAYGIETIADTRLRAEREVYFEAGDHEELIHISEPDFEVLLGGARFAGISREID